MYPSVTPLDSLKVPCPDGARQEDGPSLQDYSGRMLGSCVQDGLRDGLCVAWEKGRSFRRFRGFGVQDLYSQCVLPTLTSRPTSSSRHRLAAMLAEKLAHSHH